MTLKYRGFESDKSKKENKHSKKDKCPKCKQEFNCVEAKEQSFKIANKVFWECNCGNQVLLK